MSAVSVPTHTSGPVWPVWGLAVLSYSAVAASIPLAFAGDGGTLRLLDHHFVLDSTSRLFVLLVNVVFAGVASYVFNRVHAVPELREGIGRFSVLTLAFMAAANLSILSNH